MWDPTTYLAYADERGRPFHDLTARITASNPRAVVDLGCGPGNLTTTLAARWPDATITGIDSSPEMIAQAPAGPVTFKVGDVRDWHPDERTDVVVSNATLQWVPEHIDLLKRWVRALPPGATIAFQVPGNFDAPSHRALRALAGEWGLTSFLRDQPVLAPDGYAALLLAAGCTVDAWETTYLHVLAGGPEHPVLRWMDGTALRPVRADLPAEDWPRFRARLGELLAGEYPAADGHVLFAFRRVFVVARKAA